jgi:nucleotide-binding universal stress UspA family protein
LNPVTRVVPAWSDVLALVSSASPWCPAALTAADLARKQGSALTGCYIDPLLRSLTGADAEQPEFTLLSERPGPCADSKAGPEFRALAARHGIRRTRWVLATSGIAQTLRQLMPWHDLVVLERDLAGQDNVVSVLGEALLACKAPCLLLPPGRTALHTFPRVAVAWDGSVQAARSLHASLPLLRAAATVVLLDGMPRQVDEHATPNFDPCDYLSDHDIRVRHQRIHADFQAAGGAILENARLHEADVVVMGAYGHSTLRERVVSGATRYMLRHAELPLFMLH